MTHGEWLCMKRTRPPGTRCTENSVVAGNDRFNEVREAVLAETRPLETRNPR